MAQTNRTTGRECYNKQDLARLSRPVHNGFLLELEVCRTSINTTLCLVSGCQNAYGLKVLRDLVNEGLVEIIPKTKQSDCRTVDYKLTTKGRKVAFTIRLALGEISE